MVEEEASQPAQQSLAAGGSSSLHEDVVDDGTATDSKKRKQVAFDKMALSDLLACARGLAKRVKSADKRTLDAKRALAMSVEREKQAIARGQNKTDEEIRLLEAVRIAETKLLKSSNQWKRGTFRNMAEAIKQGTVGPDSIAAQYMAILGKNLSCTTSNSWRFSAEFSRMCSAANKVGRAALDVLRGPGGDGTQSTAPNIENMHFNMVLPSAAAIRTVDAGWHR